MLAGSAKCINERIFRKTWTGWAAWQYWSKSTDQMHLVLFNFKNINELGHGVGWSWEREVDQLSSRRASGRWCGVSWQPRAGKKWWSRRGKGWEMESLDIADIVLFLFQVLCASMSEFFLFFQRQRNKAWHDDCDPLLARLHHHCSRACNVSRAAMCAWKV